MKIVEVNDNKTVEAFRKLPFSIYANDPKWIPHLRQDVEAVFSHKQNKLLKKGKAIRWLLYNGPRVIGRIAAFINPKTSNSFEQPTGGVGFFECINDQSAAFTLFDCAREWLTNEGMEAMDGPINFGEKERFWGLITKNFDLEPYYGQNYNPPYYVPFFENYGFQKYYRMDIYYRGAKDPLQRKYREKAQSLESNTSFKVQNWTRGDLSRYMEDFRIIYNKAWVMHDGRHEMKAAQIKSFTKALRPILEERLGWFVYYEDQPIAFYLSLPEVNNWFQKVGDNLNWWGKLRFLYYKRFTPNRNSFGVAFGVVPEHQGKGVEALIFKKLDDDPILRTKYDGITITWIGDFNPKMARLVENIGGQVIREMHTYRYLFDRTKAFKRAPIIGG